MTFRAILYRIFHFSQWPLRLKMLSSLILTAALPLLVFAGFTGFARYQSDLEISQQWLERDARTAAAQIGAALDSALSEASTVSQNPQLRVQLHDIAAALIQNPGTAGDPTLISGALGLMNAAITSHPDILALRLVGAEGNLLVGTAGLLEYTSLSWENQSQHPGYLALRGLNLLPQKATLLPPYRDPETGRLLLEAAVQVAEERTPLGYLIITLDSGRLLNAPLATQIEGQLEMLAGEYLFLVNGEGWLLTPVQGLEPFQQQIEVLSPADEAEAPAGQSFYSRNWGGGAQTMTGRHSTIPGYGWTVVAETRLSDVVQPILSNLAATTLTIFAVVSLLTILLVYVINHQLIDPIAGLTRAARQIAGGQLHTAIPPLDRADEIGQLTRAVSAMTDNIRQSIETLELRVQERTRDLELTSDIMRQASTMEDIEALLDRTVNLIVQNFRSVYHAQVFLLDDAGEYAMLVASTGAPGRELLARGHRLAVGSVSVIGRVTELRQTVVARNTSTSRIHRKNEFLPDTRAEMALPLLRGQRILGALDLQSTEDGAFTQEEQSLFESLAAQLAVLVDNARQLEQITARIGEVEGRNRLLTRANWQELLASSRRPGYVEAAAGAESAGRWSRWQQQAARERAMVVSPVQADDTCFMAVPIIAREEVLGVVEWQIPANRANDNARQTARELASRLAVTLESVRLLERSERLAERERLVNEMTGQLTSEPNVGLILETAVRQLSEILQTQQVSIQLKRASVPDIGPMESV